MEAERDPSTGPVGHRGVPGDGPVPGEVPGVEGESRGGVVDVGPIEGGDLLRGEAGALAVSEVGLGRLQRPPVGGDFEPAWLDIHEVLIDPLRARLEQELLDDHLGHRVLPLTEVMEADPPLCVGDVDGRPEVIREGAPDAVVAVDRDRVLDAEGPRVRDDVVQVPLEAELGGVDADDRQAGVRVLRGPGTHVGEGPEPVDARVRPEVDEDDAPLGGPGASTAPS